MTKNSVPQIIDNGKEGSFTREAKIDGFDAWITCDRAEFRLSIAQPEDMSMRDCLANISSVLQKAMDIFKIKLLEDIEIDLPNDNGRQLMIKHVEVDFVSDEARREFVLKASPHIDRKDSDCTPFFMKYWDLVAQSA